MDHIESFLAGMSLDAYKADIRTKSAVERQLQIITEAAKRLGDDAETICPVPDWKGFAAWATFCAMVTTKWMTKLSATR